jgi:4'-phosphopantetheinyl transferase
MGISNAWPFPPARLPTPDGNVHVWRFSLDQGDSQLKKLAAVLERNELQRADRFRFSRDKGRFIAAHGLMRHILSRYTMLDPGKLRFQLGQYGKPSLANEVSDGGPRFNLSHSCGVGLLGVTGGREIGVDLEHIREDIEYGEIARRFFSSREVSKLEGLPRETRARAFFSCWASKEAYIKARGLGLSIPLDQFTLAFEQGEAAALVEVKGKDTEPGRWSVTELSLSPDYAGSVAFEGSVDRLFCWDWSEA